MRVAVSSNGNMKLKQLFYFVLFLGMFLWAVAALLSFNSFLFLFLFVCFLFLCGLWLNDSSFVAHFQMLFTLKPILTQSWNGVGVWDFCYWSCEFFSSVGLRRGCWICSRLNKIWAGTISALRQSDSSQRRPLFPSRNAGTPGSLDMPFRHSTGSRHQSLYLAGILGPG